MAFIVPSSRADQDNLFDSENIENFSSPTKGVSASDFAKSAAGYVASKYGPQILDAVGRRASDAAEGFVKGLGKGGRGEKTRLYAKPSGKNGDTNGGGGSGGRNNNSGSGNFPGYWPGTFEGANAHIDWMSPVQSGTIVNPSQEANSSYAPLIVACGELFPELDASSTFDDSYYNDILESSIYHDYLRAVENNTNKELSKQFTQTSFLNYVKDTLKALQIYYNVDSILSYSSGDGINYGMDSVRNRITPNCISAHLRLKEALEREIMNPNMVMFIRFMYQNFSLGEQKGSPLIRISYGELILDNLAGDLDYLSNGSIQEDAISRLRNPSYTATASYMRRAFPDWNIVLQPSSFDVIYSEQFINFWYNQLTSCQNTSHAQTNPSQVQYSHTMTSVYQDLHYGIEGESVDGVIYAASSVIDHSIVGKNNIQCGIWKPLEVFTMAQESDRTNIQIFKYISFKGLFNVKDRIFTMTYKTPYYDVDPTEPKMTFLESGLASKRILQVHSIANMKQAVSETVRYLLKPNVIPGVKRYKF